MPKTSIAILAKAPIPGRAKSRLIPSIGAHAAAVLQERMTAQTVETALAAGVGPVTLWCSPDPRHVSFREIARRHRVPLKRQVDGDLGARMLAAFTAGPTLVIGTDCPAFTADHLRQAATALREADVVLIPAEDGGYVLIGTHAPHAGLFTDMVWGDTGVLVETRKRIAALQSAVVELGPLWDVDTDRDLARMERELPALALL
jgi:rSAM/selenodomain-associated transferase 1